METTENSLFLSLIDFGLIAGNLPSSTENHISIPDRLCKVCLSIPWVMDCK